MYFILTRLTYYIAACFLRSGVRSRSKAKLTYQGANIQCDKHWTGIITNI
jgi:hypothetical protein